MNYMNFFESATILTSLNLYLSPLVDESSPVITGFQKTFPLVRMLHKLQVITLLELNL